jgi:NADH-quinone oxidoreductase subunit L
VTAVLTAFYMFRMYFLTFGGKARWPHGHIPHESPAVMVRPLWILAVLSVVGGWVGWPHALGGADHFAHFLEPMWPPLPEGAHAALSTEWFLMAFTLALVLCGILAARRFYLTHTELSTAWASRLSGLKHLLVHKYYVDEIYEALFVRPLVVLGRWCWQLGDRGLIDGVAHGLGKTAALLGRGGSRLQSGLVRHYLLVFTLGVVLVLAYYTLALSR